MRPAFTIDAQYSGLMAEDSIVWGEVASAVEVRVEAWLAGLKREGGASALLGEMSREPESFEFTRRLVELVAGTDDAFTSALGLREMAQEIPVSMPARDRLAVRAGGAVSLGLPWAVMPVARKWLRDRVSHLVLAARLPDSAEKPGRLTALTELLRRHTDVGIVPVLAPSGDAVYGPLGVRAEVERLAGLAAHPLVKHLVVDPARLAPGGTDWSADDDARAAALALAPVLEAAKQSGTTIALAPRSVRWARLVPEVMTHALADPSFDSVRFGIHLMAELPEAREQYSWLSRYAQRRLADGGAPSEVTIGLAGVAGSERIESLRSGLAVPVIEGRGEVTTQLVRLAELALHPGRAASLRPVIQTEDPRVLATVAEVATRLGSAELSSVQLRRGIVPGLAETIAEDFQEVRVLVPVVPPQEFGGALDVLLGFAAEAADPDSVVARLESSAASVTGPLGSETADAAADPAPLAQEAAWFREVLAAVPECGPVSRRTQQRAREWDPSERDSALFYRAPDEPARFDTGGLTAAVLGLTRGSSGELRLDEVSQARAIPAVSSSGFANEPATDASLQLNREWARGLARRAAEDAAAVDAENPTIALSAADLDPARAAELARAAGEAWAEHAPGVRAVRLRRAALATVAARDRLLQSLVRDTGAPVAEIDRQIGEIIDAARYSGLLAERLAAVRGATFVAEGLALVVADNSFSFAAQAEAVLSALAAGSGVMWTMPSRLAPSARALIEEWEVGGLPAGVVHVEAVVDTETGGTLARLAAEPGIDRAVVLGERRFVHDLARYRPDLRVEGRLPAPGFTLVTPSADFEAAVRDAVSSAFSGAGAGAHPGASAGLLLLGGAARSRRFRDGLADAVRQLRVGDSARPGTADPLGFDIGPLPAPPTPDGLRALTELERGEQWLVRPEQLDDAGLLWRPGVRIGVSAGSRFWRDAVGVPVIGVAHMHTLGEALALQNTGGAVAGLQSYDADEILAWLDGAEAASLFVNRPTSDARTERQPSGGWNAAAVGLAGLSGGPNRLLTLGAWSLRPGTPSATLHLRGLEPEVTLLIETMQPMLGYEEFDSLRRAALSDALAWRTSFGVLRDELELGIERNVLRYHQVPTQLRFAEGGSLAALVRVLAAALLTRSPVEVSTGEVLPVELSRLLERGGIEVSLERDGDWLERLAIAGAAAGTAQAPGPGGVIGSVSSTGMAVARIRLIGGDRARAAEWLGGLEGVSLWAEPVTMAGPVELLTLLREQSVSARAHRHGLAVPVPGLDELLEE